MQLLFREYFRADCGCDVGAIQESDEDTVHENAIINDFLAAPDALSVLARILRELAEPSSADAEEELSQL